VALTCAHFGISGRAAWRTNWLNWKTQLAAGKTPRWQLIIGHPIGQSHHANDGRVKALLACGRIESEVVVSTQRF
jgi:hypothetical protein